MITQSVSGGAQKYVFDLATGLDKQKYEVAVAAGGTAELTNRPAERGGDGELFGRLESAGVKVFRLKWLTRPIRPFYDIKAYFEIKKLLKNWQPNVLHLNSSKAGVLGCLAARNIKIYSPSEGRPTARTAEVEGSKMAFDSAPLRSDNKILVIYTVHGAVFEASFSWLSRKMFLGIEKLTAEYKNKIICVSEHDRTLWLKYKVAPDEKLVTIHNGIDLNISFLPKEEARKKLLGHNCEQCKNCQIIGFIGYFYPEKNLETLIEAFTKLLTKNYQLKTKLLIIGNGPQENSLKFKVQSSKLNEKILFLGALPGASKYLKAFDVFVLPSIKEGLPYTILEAMAAGVPVVASAVGGIPELIQDSVNGFLIKPKDAEALAKKILQIIENSALAQKFSQNSLEKIKEFSLEKMVEKTQDQY